MMFVFLKDIVFDIPRGRLGCGGGSEPPPYGMYTAPTIP